MRQCCSYLIYLYCFYQAFNISHFDIYSTLQHFKLKHYFSKIFLSLALIKWKKLDQNNPNSKSFNNFQVNISKFIIPSKNIIFLCSHPKGMQLITRLKFDFSHLQKHKFKYNFHDILILNLLLSWKNPKLHVTAFSNIYSIQMNTFWMLFVIDNSILELSDVQVASVLLHVKLSLDISSS